MKFRLVLQKKNADSKAVQISPFSTFRSILRCEGFTALYSGLGPRGAKVAPGCAIMVAVYEFGKHYVATYDEDE